MTMARTPGAPAARTNGGGGSGSGSGSSSNGNGNGKTGTGKAHGGYRGGSPDADEATATEQLDAKTQEALANAAQLASLIVQQPHRFGIDGGDADLGQKSLEALKAVFDYALDSEGPAILPIAQTLASALPEEDTSTSTSTTSDAGPSSRQHRAGTKRKRAGDTAGSSSSHRLFEPTPLSELTTEGMGPSQLWEQLELRNTKICRLLDTIIVKEDAQAQDEDEDEDEDEGEGDFPEGEEALDELEKKRKQTRRSDVNQSEDASSEEGGDEEEEDGDEEQMVRSLKGLSDADLRALGLDPSRRAEIEALDEEGFDDDDDDEDDDDEEGYPGASDLSDDDEYSGKTLTEPLLSEEQQMRNKAVAERRERQQMGARMRFAGSDEDDEDGSESESDAEDDTYQDGEGGEDEEGDESDGDESSDGEERGENSQSKSILDNLDARGGGSSSGRRPKRHAELDDDFFSIDQFNADTDDYGDEGPDLGDDVDLFKAMDEEEEEEQERPLYYADFFAPPPWKTQQQGEKRKGKQANNSDHADAPVQKKPEQIPSQNRRPESLPQTASSEPKRKPSVRFNEQVAVRRIKARRQNEYALTPELLQQLTAQQQDVDVDEDEDEETGSEESDVGTRDSQSDSDLPDGESDGGGDENEAPSSSEFDEDDSATMDVDGNASDQDGIRATFDDEGGSDVEDETARRVAGDLFADNGDDEESGDDAMQSRHSSHEKRLQALQQEISRLEDENVAKKDWTLMGEAGSRVRAENSLLEEDLEFESNAKAKPVITPETTSTLEDMIKKRILEGNYDDVQRRATLNPMDFLPSKMLELSDQKSAKSLDQVYEDEMGVGQSGDSHGAKLDKELQREHEEIDGLYDALERQLDALSNAHYTPKAPKVSIRTMTNAPAVTLEESLPSSMSHASQLAPEEVYEAGGRHNEALEGALSEMTPEEKQRRHRQLRDEKRARNVRIAEHRRNVEINREAFGQSRGGRFVGRGGGGGGGNKSGKGNAAEEKDAALRKLMGNKGVSVVGKGSNDATGSARSKQQRQPQQPLNAAHLKL